MFTIIKILKRGIHLYSKSSFILKKNLILSLNKKPKYVINNRVKIIPEYIIDSIKPLSKTEYEYKDIIECFKAACKTFKPISKLITLSPIILFIRKTLKIIVMNKSVNMKIFEILKFLNDLIKVKRKTDKNIHKYVLLVRVKNINNEIKNIDIK